MHEFLRLLRVFNDFKANEFAKKLEISTSYLSEIEKGKKKVTLDILNKYAEVLNTKTSTLMYIAEGFEKDSNKFRKILSTKIVEFLYKIENEASKVPLD
ncbi:helix-turn-helix domain-containing protein [Leptospira kmetyi]|uniref:helix-turn-helix domain-containing protein n=1 Tax=Leptospira kmetyi TaxID=408139 RepID=UPI001FCB822A|nr:helix-turn-helix transcriptional regulator [Leptospira kmetyi]